jgi:hypothetical protein
MAAKKAAKKGGKKSGKKSAKKGAKKGAKKAAKKAAKRSAPKRSKAVGNLRDLGVSMNKGCGFSVSPKTGVIKKFQLKNQPACSM